MTLMTADVTEVPCIDGAKGIPLPALHTFNRQTVWKPLQGTNCSNVPTTNISVVECAKDKQRPRVPNCCGHANWPVYYGHLARAGKKKKKWQNHLPIQSVWWRSSTLTNSPAKINKDTDNKFAQSPNIVWKNESFSFSWQEIKEKNNKAFVNKNSSFLKANTSWKKQTKQRQTAIIIYYILFEVHTIQLRHLKITIALRQNQRTIHFTLWKTKQKLYHISDCDAPPAQRVHWVELHHGKPLSNWRPKSMSQQYANPVLLMMSHFDKDELKPERVKRLFHGVFAGYSQASHTWSTCSGKSLLRLLPVSTIIWQ